MPIKKYELRPVAIGEINAELTVAERRLVTGFLQRRHELLPKAREELAQRLARSAVREIWRRAFATPKATSCAW